MVRVAVEVSGYMRTFFECVKSWENIFEPNKENYIFDFFLHTYKYHGYSMGFVQKEILEDEEVDILKIKENIKITSYVIEDNQNDLNYENRVKLMYRKIYLCHELVKDYEIKNKFKYDIYIRLRPDLIIGNILEIPQVSNNTGVFNQFVWDDVQQNGMLCDQMFICDSKCMDNCSNIFTEWDLIGNKHPETMLFNQMLKKQVNVGLKNFNIRIKR